MKWTQLLGMLLAIGVVPSAALAQLPFDPLNTREIELARSALLASAPVQQSLGASPRYAIVNVERHLEAKGATAPARRADVLLYNYRTGETVSAVVDLRTSRIDALRVTRDSPPPLGAEEVESAKQLAAADGAVRARLQSAGVATSDSGSLIVTHLFGRSGDAADPCATNRCVLLFFNTRAAFLFAAAVDLTESRVRMLGASDR